MYARTSRNRRRSHASHPTRIPLSPRVAGFLLQPWRTDCLVDDADCIDALRDAAETLGESPTKAAYGKPGLAPASPDSCPIVRPNPSCVPKPKPARSSARTATGWNTPPRVRVKATGFSKPPSFLGMQSCGVVANHEGFWGPRRRFESSQDYSSAFVTPRYGVVWFSSGSEGVCRWLAVAVTVSSARVP
jgi:hypothetical protein